MFAVTVKIKILPGKEQEWERIFAERRRMQRTTEPDTIMYDLFRSTSDPLTYFAVQRFTSKEAFYGPHRTPSAAHDAAAACVDGEGVYEFMEGVPGCV